jgi:hypothetical protein
MSAIQMIIANIQSLNDTDRAQVLSHFAKSAVPAPKSDTGPTKSLEVKKQNANKGRPTCHGDFVKKILEEQKDAAAAFKEANKEMKGAHLIFVANYKKEHAEQFTAFEVAWKEAHPKVEAAPAAVAEDDVATVASEPVAEAKPKRVITDEQKAKMKAGREASANAKKAKKEADAARVVAVSMAAELMGHGEAPDDIAVLMATPEAKPEQQVKKRGPKKLDAMTPEELAKHNAKKAERQAKKAADKAAGRPTLDTDSGSDASAPSVPSARSASPKLKGE